MSLVTFTAAFSGGAGTLKIQIPGKSDLDFTDDGAQIVDLPSGTISYTASGAAANGPGGGANLTITGTIITDSPQHYGPGLIPPNIHPILVL